LSDGADAASLRFARRRNLAYHLSTVARVGISVIFMVVLLGPAAV
jgi:hypothetical protein